MKLYAFFFQKCLRCNEFLRLFQRSLCKNMSIAKHGYPCSMRYASESKQELAQILKREHLQRDRQAVPGDFHSYLCKLEQSSVHKQLRTAKSIVTTAAHLHDNKDMPEL